MAAVLRICYHFISIQHNSWKNDHILIVVEKLIFLFDFRVLFIWFLSSKAFVEPVKILTVAIVSVNEIAGGLGKVWAHDNPNNDFTGELEKSQPTLPNEENHTHVNV